MKRASAALAPRAASAWLFGAMSLLFALGAALFVRATYPSNLNGSVLFGDAPIEETLRTVDLARFGVDVSALAD